MGGSAFSAGKDSLYTPRMPRHIYQKAKDRCMFALRDLFNIVESPIDGPGKTDFGDIDILLYELRDATASKEKVVDSIASVIRATRVIMERSDEISLHLAVPWAMGENTSAGPAPKDVPIRSLPVKGISPRVPDSKEDGDVTVSENSMTDDGDDDDKFIQVDVRVCRDIKRLRWMLFKHAHGDIWNMIGTTIRPYGLTADEQALWLRVPEIEKTNKKRAKIFLTDERDDILRFLDLDPERYWSGPFESVGAMAEYVAQCRMFWVPPQIEDASTSDKEDAQSEDRKKLKANDRKRMKQRPGFRVWVDEFYPKCRAEGRYLVRKTSREEVTQEVFKRFGVRKQYEQQRHEFLIDKNKDSIWNNVIKGAFPAPDNESDIQALQYRGTMVKAFKRIILENTDRYGVTASTDLRDSDGFFIPERVIDFITRNQDEVARVAREEQQTAYNEKKCREGDGTKNARE